MGQQGGEGGEQDKCSKEVKEAVQKALSKLIADGKITEEDVNSSFGGQAGDKQAQQGGGDKQGQQKQGQQGQGEQGKQQGQQKQGEQGGGQPKQGGLVADSSDSESSDS